MGRSILCFELNERCWRKSTASIVEFTPRWLAVNFGTLRGHHGAGNYATLTVEQSEVQPWIVFAGCAGRVTTGSMEGM